MLLPLFLLLLPTSLLLHHSVTDATTVAACCSYDIATGWLLIHFFIHFLLVLRLQRSCWCYFSSFPPLLLLCLGVSNAIAAACCCHCHCHRLITAFVRLILNWSDFLQLHWQLLPKILQRTAISLIFNVLLLWCCFWCCALLRCCWSFQWMGANVTLLLLPALASAAAVAAATGWLLPIISAHWKLLLQPLCHNSVCIHPDRWQLW